MSDEPEQTFGELVDVETITVKQAFLGLHPYVLVEFIRDDEAPAGFRIAIDAGGPSVTTEGDVQAILELTLATFADRELDEPAGEVQARGDELVLVDEPEAGR